MVADPTCDTKTETLKIVPSRSTVTSSLRSISSRSSLNTRILRSILWGAGLRSVWYTDARQGRNLQNCLSEIHWTPWRKNHVMIFNQSGRHSIWAQRGETRVMDNWETWRENHVIVLLITIIFNILLLMQQWSFDSIICRYYNYTTVTMARELLWHLSWCV